MCEFCNDIESVSDIRDIEDHCLSSGILFDKSDGKYWLRTCRYGYDYGDALDIVHCPICGRKLSEV